MSMSPDTAPEFASFDPAALWDGLDAGLQRALGIAALTHAAGAIGSGQWLAPLNAFMAAEAEGLCVIEQLVRDAAPHWSERPTPPALAALGIDQCRSCGCTENVGCEEGCCWVEPGLCSSCADRRQAAAGTE